MSTSVIDALEIPDFQVHDLGSNTTGTCSVTNNDATVTFSTALPARYARRYGHQILINSVLYTIASTAEDRLSVELTAVYAGSTNASRAFILYPAVDLVITNEPTFTPLNSTTPIPAASVGSQSFYKRLTCTVKPNSSGILSLFVPSFTIACTTDIPTPAEQGARYFPRLYRLSNGAGLGSRIPAQFLGLDSFIVSPSTTTWAAIRRLTNPGTHTRNTATTYTDAQIESLVSNATTISGTVDRLLKKTSGGTGDSALYETAGDLVATGALSVTDAIDVGGAGVFGATVTPGAYATASLPAASAAALAYDSTRKVPVYATASGWVPLLNYIDVRSCGAVPDNGTDDFAAFVLAVAQAVSAKIPVVFAGEGTWVLSDELKVPDGITILGAGVDKTIIQYTKATGAAIRATDYAVAQYFNTFRGFTLVATGSAINTNTVGLDLSSMNHSAASWVTVRNFGTQVLLDGHRAGGALVATFYNSLYDVEAALTSPQAHVTRGIAIQGEANSNTIYRPRFSYLDYPILVGNSSDAPPNEIGIFNPVMELWETYGVYILKGYGIQIYGGRYEGANTVFKVADSVSDVQGVVFDRPYLETSGNPTVLDSKNPTVHLKAGNFHNFKSYETGQSSAIGANLVANGLFEAWSSSTALLAWNKTSTLDWASSASVTTRESTVVRTGYAVRIGDGATNSLGIATAQIPIDATVPYILSYQAAVSNTAVGWRVGLRFFDSAGVQITSSWTTSTGIDLDGSSTGFSYDAGFAAWINGSDQTLSSANTYSLESLIITPPATAKTVQIALIKLTSAANYLYVDDFQFCQGRTAHHATDRWLAMAGDQTYYGNLTLTGDLTASALTATTVPYLDASKVLKSSAVTPTELGYVSGVTSAIQTQLNAKQGTLTNSAGLAAALGDETGSGAAVFATSPTLVTPILGVATATSVTSTNYLSTPSSPAQITSNQNDYALTLTYNIRLSSDASRNITGIVAGTSGQTCYLTNVGAQDIVLKHADGASVAANQFTTTTGADLTITPNKMARIWYDGTSAKWRAVLLP